MKTSIYKFGAAAVALALAGLPAAALADTNGSDTQDSVNATAQVTAQVQGTGSANASARVRGDGHERDFEASSSSDTGEMMNDHLASSSEAAQHMAEQARERAQQAAENARENAKQGIEKAFEMAKNGVPFMLDASTTPALSFAQLQQMIQERKQELDQEEASTSPEVQDIMKNVNPVRLAVHSLLASKDLLGGIGAQVSQIAQQMNDSVATTTRAEAQIQSRGFFTKLFFGGDTSAADAISQEVSQNQQRIDDLTKLLNQANISADVKTTLTAQVTALEDAQARLQTLAQQQKSLWGLFSWRF